MPGLASMKIKQAKNTCKCVQHRRKRKKNRSYTQSRVNEVKEGGKKKENAQTVVVSSL
jgi:hypothetical protein